MIKLKSIAFVIFFFGQFSFLKAQLEMDFAVGGLNLHQTGVINYIDPLYPLFGMQRISVDRNITVFGATMTFFHPLKYPVLTERGYVHGPQAGIGFNYMKHNQTSSDPSYNVVKSDGYFAFHFGVFRIPLGYSFRYGIFRESVHYSGFIVSAGTELNYLRIPDERAFATLPYTELMGVYQKFGLRFVFYPFSFRSFYDSNFGRVERLKSRFFRFEISWNFK